VVLPEKDDEPIGPEPRSRPHELPLAGTIARDDQGRYVLHAVGEIDIATVSTLRETFGQLMRTATGSATIDLSDIAFMDCHGVTALLEAADRARVEGIRLSVVASPRISQLIRLTGLYAVLDVYDRLDDVPGPTG
jgi:anti-sigma B factor antagonist